MRKILVVDDEHEVRETMAMFLKTRGYDVKEAGDGGEGFEVARQYRPDLILSDILMPNVDGYTFLENLRSDTATQPIPFIFLSARTGRSHLREGMTKGADDYLAKPILPIELINAVETRLNRHGTIIERVQERMDDLRANITDALTDELRNPLHSILGYAKLIHDDSSGFSHTEIKEMSGCIKKSAERLHHLLENFLLYTRLEVLRGDDNNIRALRNARSANAGKFMRILAAQTATEFQRRDDLVFDIRDDESIAISDHYLRIVVTEIVSNACKFSSPGTPIKVSVQSDNEVVTASVSDKGRGMTGAELASLGAFVQFGRNSNPHRGAGLGISITQRIIEIFDGVFRIQSDVGVGTTVSFSLTKYWHRPCERSAVSENIFPMTIRTSGRNSAGEE